MAVVAVGDIDAAADRSRRSRRRSAPLTARGAGAPEPDRDGAAAPGSCWSASSTDPEVTQSSRVRSSASGQRESEQTRRRLPPRPGRSGSIEHMINERFGELARKPDAKFLGAGVGGGGAEPRRRRPSRSSARVAGRQDRRRPRRRSRSRPSASASSASARPSSTAPRSGWPAFYERAYNERDKTESGSFAQEYLNYFLDGEPSPGIDYEYQLVQQLLPTITAAEVVGAGADAARRRQPRDPGDVAAEGRRQGADRGRAAGRAGRGRRAPRSRRGPTRRRPRALMEHKPDAGADRVAPRDRRARRHGRPLRERRRGVAEADRLQERSGAVHADAPGGASLAPPADYLEASLATALRRACPAPAGSRRSTCRSCWPASSRRRVAVHRALDPRHLRQRARRRSSKPRCSCSIRSSPRRATTPRRSR